jgi:hypothetical protein
LQAAASPDFSAPAAPTFKDAAGQAARAPDRIIVKLKKQQGLAPKRSQVTGIRVVQLSAGTSVEAALQRYNARVGEWRLATRAVCSARPTGPGNTTHN